MVHRAKQQVEKDVTQGRQKAAAIAQQLPTSYVVKQDIGGVPQDVVRRLTVAVYERAMENAIGRGLLRREDRSQPWTVSALFASMFDDHTIKSLNKRGYLRWDERCRGEAIIAAVNRLLARHL